MALNSCLHAATFSWIYTNAVWAEANYESWSYWELFLPTLLSRRNTLWLVDIIWKKIDCKSVDKVGNQVVAVEACWSFPWKHHCLHKAFHFHRRSYLLVFHKYNHLKSMMIKCTNMSHIIWPTGHSRTLDKNISLKKCKYASRYYVSDRKFV